MEAIYSSEMSVDFELTKRSYIPEDTIFQIHIKMDRHAVILYKTNWNLTLWPGSASELYRPNDRPLSANLVTIFAERGCHVVSATDPYCRILVF
jgi:hypothetical protein